MVKYDSKIKGGERSIVHGQNIALMITCYLYTIHRSTVHAVTLHSIHQCES